MATYSSIHAWEIPWTEETGRLHTVHGVAKEIRHNLATNNWAPPCSVCTRDTEILVKDQGRSQFKHNYEYFLSQGNIIHSNNSLPCSISLNIQEIHW